MRFFVNKQKKIDEKENIDIRRCVVMDQVPEIGFLSIQNKPKMGLRQAEQGYIFIFCQLFWYI